MWRAVEWSLNSLGMFLNSHTPQMAGQGDIYIPQTKTSRWNMPTILPVTERVWWGYGQVQCVTPKNFKF
jgi:hypothetical protein